MKKRLIYALAIATVFIAGVGDAAAQHYFGVRAGYGSGSSRLYPQRNFEIGTLWGLYSGGVSWKYYTEEKLVGGIEVDVLLMQQGFKTMTLNILTAERETGYERRVNAIMVPICWQPHVYMFRQRLRVFMNAGVTFSYVLSSTEKDISYIDGTSSERDYHMRLTRDNRAGYGLVGGGGISWAAGRLELFAEARYYIGYSDVLKNWNKNETNKYLRSPLDGLQLSVGVFWRLGKGGIKSPQGQRVSEEAVRDMIRDDAVVVPVGPETGTEVGTPESEQEKKQE